MWASTLLDAAMHREWLFRLGRLGATGRVAHFFAETNARLQAIGLSDGNGYDLPITQTDLSEITGLTSIHVNRVLRSLRESRTCVFRFSRVEILDRGQLEQIGQFDPTYLYLTPPAADRAPEPTGKEPARMLGGAPFTEGRTAVVEEGIALLDGPDATAIAMTPDAAEQTGNSLIAAAHSAREQHVGGS